MIDAIILWQILGGAILVGLIVQESPFDIVTQADGIEFVNPAFVYKHNRVNWFGACVVALFYSLICPAATIGYWFYKLCVIGRK